MVVGRSGLTIFLSPLGQWRGGGLRATEGWEWEDAFRLTISKEGVCWGLERIAAASLDQKAAVFLWTVLQASPSTHWNLYVETEFLDPQGGGCQESLGQVMPSVSTRAVLL